MQAAPDTPLIAQWRQIKARHPEAVLFFRVGDFYEAFYQDAETLSRVLELTLTSRNNGSSKAPMAGIPARAKDEYTARLVRAGHRVAICEQVEDPAEAKGIVRREVVEVLTPGAITSDALLEGRRNNFLACLVVQGETAGIAAVDISTGEFRSVRTARATLADEIARIEPSELLVAEGEDALAGLSLSRSLALTHRARWIFEDSAALECVLAAWDVQRLEGLGFTEAGDEVLVRSAGALLRYLGEIQPGALSSLERPLVRRGGEAMALDDMTRRNLELVETLRRQDEGGTLLGVLDHTRTPMGARLLRSWLLHPLMRLAEIQERQDSLSTLVAAPRRLKEIRERLQDVRDLERLTNKVRTRRITPREMRALTESLRQLPGLATPLREAGCPRLGALALRLDPLADVASLLDAALVDAPPASAGEGGVLRSGYHAEVDELRRIHDGATDFIAQMEARERERTGIERGLKIGFNRIFGYYIEVTKTNLERVPEEYIRKQTIANGERFYTAELGAWEEKVTGAAERLQALELEVYQALREQVAAEADRLAASAEVVARLDVLASLADLAERRGYVRPEVHDGFDLEIRGGRHPVVECMLPPGEFIPNDVVLDAAGRVAILTGPNAAGKSTVLRMVGLVQLLAQMGSFVPATRARLPLADRIFTRVGASDSLAQGMSTFMVEMTETASILSSASPRSLVLLDEIGRGTSTLDGVSLAMSIAEYLRDEVGAKTIFATHFHEVTALEAQGAGVVNWSVSVREDGERIVLLRKLQAGPAGRSHGITIGRLAGLPPAVIARARARLAELEKSGPSAPTRRVRGARESAAEQLSFVVGAETPPPAEEPAYARTIRELDLDRTTPLQALQLLAQIKGEIAAAP
jgi:DNA mismatch repair protein MutS